MNRLSKPISLARFALAPLALSIGLAQANEGMWMPQQLPQIAKDLKATGLAIDPASLSKLTEFPMGAIISLGGCTASFVSPQGLVVTNHHCAYGSIQYNSTPVRDLLKKGFLAQSLEEELPAAPGSRVYVTEAVRDVSAQILDAKTTALKGKVRSDAIEANQKKLVAECEQDKGYRCTVSRFYGGLVFQLIKQLEIRDVRLVHAPADMVGRFGGETDNWVWPRHTGDYSFYRAYVGPDGKPADYNLANKPYAPKFHLKLASEPLKEGDFVMVTGYPGGTDRHRLPTEVDFNFGWEAPELIRIFGEALELIKQETAGRREAEIKLAGLVQGYGNSFKNMQGQQESYTGSDILARKTAAFHELKAWVNGDAKRSAQYGASIAEIERLLAERQSVEKRELLLNFSNPLLLTTARSLYQQAQQNLKPDAERRPGFQQRDALRRRQGLEALERRYDEQTDMRLASHFLAQYLALPADQLNATLLKTLGVSAGMDEVAVKARLGALYAGSKLGDKAERLAWLGRSVDEFKASSDPFIAAAVALYEDDEARDARNKELGGHIQQAYAGVMKALIAFKASRGQAVYPDANGTLRVSFGKVAGRAQGTIDGTSWSAFTTLRGIPAKHTGKGDFDAPAQQLAAIKARQFDKYRAPELDSVPVNFLATLDTTGGNSGSPVLNRKAELVGLLFDGTLDAVISDWDFNPKTTRSICLDARYMLWQMKVVDKADKLLKELNAL
ncbi:S46 family peptidase [Paucibacter sp. APW11]|uniref:Dipeptidyl-peptidase n=1 Tax=Roseateles aquae TaxID=3077235 RepID=A0ABU3P7A4_9BURK|nr:S46 family peptidase [Paucibacter sp. APW11]MDT8998439.1 S46 family peptidase [Paucibacter sp. APW11]